MKPFTCHMSAAFPSTGILLAVGDAVDGDGEGVLEHLLLFLGGVLLRQQPFQNLGLQDVQRVDVRVPDLDEVESIRQRETDSEWVACVRGAGVDWVDGLMCVRRRQMCAHRVCLGRSAVFHVLSCMLPHLSTQDT